MVYFLASAARAAIVALRCPKCGLVQARARRKENARYRCKGCSCAFSLDEGKLRDRER